MKKFFWFLILAVLFSSCSSTYYYSRKDVLIPFSQISTDAAFKQFKKADKMNQSEILNNFIREANAEYKRVDDIDGVRNLRENVVLIQRYLASGRQSFMPIQKDYNILYNKINKTIREYEGCTTVYREEGVYYDFGQELDTRYYRKR